MDIVFYPDPVLRRRAAPVDPAAPGLEEFVAGMLEAMLEAQGVGLAAPQVGRGARIFVASDTGKLEDAIVCLNPRVEPFGPVVEMEEGCLSVPGIRAQILRPEGVRLEYVGLDGAVHKAEYGELMARIIQHEQDHLDGVLFFERMGEADRLRIRPDLEALEEQFLPRG